MTQKFAVARSACRFQEGKISTYLDVAVVEAPSLEEAVFSAGRHLRANYPLRDGWTHSTIGKPA